MYIIPTPYKVILQEGIFKLRPDTLLLLEVSCNAEDLKAVQLLKEEILIELGLDLKINKGFKPFEKLSAIRWKFNRTFLWATNLKTNYKTAKNVFKLYDD